MDEQQTPSVRRYRILSLLGSGGFGNVYRARLESEVGFTKEVALKIIRDSAVSAADLARFRDEARILGLARDRAVVAVESPIRLDGRWAIVMELVDGASLDTLMRRGLLPPVVALEVVGEVARSLHKVYHQAGPDGQPLHIVHHDLKPSNLQLTPDGDVKLLDFGVARARFESREAQTTTSIGGTIGYIAPERLLGSDGPESDVYSLGVLLHVVMTGRHPFDTADIEPGGLPGRNEALALASAMRASDPAERPTASEVERRCAALVEGLGGPSLRRWAGENVTVANDGRSDDPLVGAVLTDRIPEVSATFVYPPAASIDAPPPSTGHSRAVLLVAALAFVIASGVAALTVSAGGATAAVVWWARLRLPDPSPVELPDPTEVGPNEPAPDEPILDPELEQPLPVPGAEVPDPGSRAPAPIEPPPGAEVPKLADGRLPKPPRIQPPEPTPISEPAPVSEPISPTPAPPDLIMASFDSSPTGALVVLDGIPIGRTPLNNHPVAVGQHELQFRWDGQDAAPARSVRIGGRHGNQRFSWQDGQLVAR